MVTTNNLHLNVNLSPILVTIKRRKDKEGLFPIFISFFSFLPKKSTLLAGNIGINTNSFNSCIPRLLSRDNMMVVRKTHMLNETPWHQRQAIIT